MSVAGAAQISIPIVVSPSTAGMQPKPAISYSSQGGNGPLGLGFSLSGLSAISRVGRTVAQDGVKGGVTFDAKIASPSTASASSPSPEPTTRMPPSIASNSTPPPASAVME